MNKSFYIINENSELEQITVEEFIYYTIHNQLNDYEIECILNMNGYTKEYFIESLQKCMEL